MNEMMTGQEWHDRFKKEMQEYDVSRLFTPEEQKIADEQGREYVAMRWMYAAVKRASGVDIKESESVDANTADKDVVMSGREWYKRFTTEAAASSERVFTERQLEINGGSQAIVAIALNWAFEAARVASGAKLKEELKD